MYRAVRAGTQWINLVAIFALVFCTSALADNIPPKPSTYLYDPSYVIPQAIADQINLALTQYERQTSNQVLVAIFPDLPEGESLEDFTQRTAEAWQVGQKDRNNGVVLFVFIKPRQMRIEVGYGLEGALPDAMAHRIILDEIAPSFKLGDYTGGIIRGVNAIFAAIQGEYRGTGAIASELNQEDGVAPGAWFLLFFFGSLLFLFFLMLMNNRGGYQYGPFGGSRSTPFFGMPFFGMGGDDDDDDDNPFGGGGGGGGGSFGGFGGGGGFSGGGGSFGGGGASGGW